MTQSYLHFLCPFVGSPGATGGRTSRRPRVTAMPFQITLRFTEQASENKLPYAVVTGTTTILCFHGVTSTLPED